MRRQTNGLPSQPQGITTYWLVPNYTAWWVVTEAYVCKQPAHGVAFDGGVWDSNPRPVDRIGPMRHPNHSATESHPLSCHVITVCEMVEKIVHTQSAHNAAILGRLCRNYMYDIQPDTETETKTLFIKPLYSLKSLTLSQLLRVNSQPWTLHVLML